jgi:type I restriction enzyme S subunit
MNNPDIRFKGYAGSWEQSKLKDVADKVTEKNTALLVQETFTNSAEFGVISQRDFFERDISNADNIGGYYVIHKEDFVYNPRISTSAPVGPVNRNKLGRSGIMSPLYTIFRTHDVDTTYLEWFFKSRNWHPFMYLNGDSGARSDRFSIKDTVFFGMPIPLPCQDEQKRIGAWMNGVDNLITLNQRKLDTLKNYKKAMLVKMFPREGQKVPEIRFKGFSGDWEQHKLSDLCSLVTKQTGFDYSENIKPSLVTEAREDTYPFIQNKDFDGENINLNTDFYIPITVAERFPKITLDTPSLLISISGKIGNVGYYRLSSKAFIGGAVGICKLLEDNGRILLFALQSDTGQQIFHSMIKASSHSNITVEDIRGIKLFLPKDKEEYILLGDYFHNLDTLISLNQHKLDKLKDLKQAMLNKMFVKGGN